MPPPMANAVGGRTARACDHCIRHRARWYCAADDAFLCQPCDASVHSANTLAGRHHRLRLNPPSTLTPPPSWPRKPRTPRGQTQKVAVQKTGTLVVPDLDENIVEEEVEVEQLLYQVPIFDPFLSEFSPRNVLMNEKTTFTTTQSVVTVPTNNLYQSPAVEIDEFDTADMESLLGTGFDEEQFCIEGALGLVEKREEDLACCLLEDGGGVKVEFESGETMGVDVDGVIKMEFERETLDMDFDYESPETVEEVGCEMASLALKLDYEKVIVAWDGQGSSPWMDGRRPEQDIEIWGPDYTGMIWGGAGEAATTYSEAGHAAVGDTGREARVSRYREKRRTRLFSKKIRYEVRKLNAEKRPRMKGRFVKRSSFPMVGSGGPFSY